MIAESRMIADTGVDVVQSEDNFFPEQPIKLHQQSAIEDLKFVIPEYMENLGLRAEGVRNEPSVIFYDARDFCYCTCGRSLVAPEVQKVQPRLIAKFFAFEMVAANDVQSRALRIQFRG